jgi:alkanesulfonate monooxygenase SsuD/methylene tetrahydromethanopterin reductase-like flavin-dependent oxidoreductase (luciferase family)
MREVSMQRRAIALFTTDLLKTWLQVAKLADDANFDSVWNGEFFNRNGL